MSDISPISRPSSAGLESVGRPARQDSVPAVSSVRTADKAEFSRTAQLLSKLAQLPDVRHDLVDRVRTQIAEGTYETPQKLDAAVDELIADL